MANINIQNTLQKLGLNDNEALLYSLMLENPKSTVRELSIRSPFSRTMLYHILNDLSQRGLVTNQDSGPKTIYIAEDPEKLYELLSKKEDEFNLDKRKIEEAIPKLKNKYRLSSQRPGIRIFEGIEEYKKALEDILLTKPDVILAYDQPGVRKPALETRENFEGQRISKKIEKKVLYFDSDSQPEKKQHNDFTQFRSLDKKTLEPFQTDFMQYGGKILYTTYQSREPIAVLIEDKNLFDMQEKIFMSLWKKAKDQTLITFKN